MAQSQYFQQFATTNENDDVPQGFLATETRNLLNIVKLRELYRFKSHLVHYRYDFTPKVECSIAELAWGFVKDPWNAVAVAENLERILPDIRDEAPVFVREWENIDIHTNATMEMISETTTVEYYDDYDNYEDVPALEEVQEDPYADMPGLEEVQQGEQEMPVLEDDDSYSRYSAELDNLLQELDAIVISGSKTPVPTANFDVDRIPTEIEVERFYVTEEVNTIESVPDQFSIPESNYDNLLVRVFTVQELKKHAGADLANPTLVPENQCFYVTKAATFAGSVWSEIMDRFPNINYKYEDEWSVFVFSKRANGTIRPAKLIEDYTPMSNYQERLAVNGEVWLLLLETPEPKENEVVIYKKWFYKHWFYFQGFQVAQYSKLLSDVFPSKTYSSVFEEICSLYGDHRDRIDHLETNETIDMSELYSGDIVIYTKQPSTPSPYMSEIPSDEDIKSTFANIAKSVAMRN